MTRILADLPDEDIKWLDELAAEQGKSRASVLREAVAAYRDGPRYSRACPRVQALREGFLRECHRVANHKQTV